MVHLGEGTVTGGNIASAVRKLRQVLSSRSPFHYIQDPCQPKGCYHPQLGWVPHLNKPNLKKKERKENSSQTCPEIYFPGNVKPVKLTVSLSTVKYGLLCRELEPSLDHVELCLKNENK